VYAGRLRLEDGRAPWGGVFVPDRGDGRQSVFGGVMEIHLPGFSGDLYGQRVELRFGRRLRGFVAFGSEAEARERIRRDLQEMEDEAGRIEEA
jgi:FAD synthase